MCIKIKLTFRRRGPLCYVLMVRGVHMRVIITVEICARPKPVCCRPKDVKKRTRSPLRCAILQATASPPPSPPIGTERRRVLLGVGGVI